MHIQTIQVKVVRCSREEANDLWNNWHKGKTFHVDGKKVVEYRIGNDGHPDTILLEGEKYPMELVPDDSYRTDRLDAGE